jgi:hypothetical protein
MKEPAFIYKDELRNNPEELYKTYTFFLGCLDIDSDDSLVLAQPTNIGSLMVELASQNEVKTNEDFKKILELATKDEAYLASKTKIVGYLKVIQLEVTPQLFEEENEMFEEALIFQKIDKERLADFVEKENLWNENLQDVFFAYAEKAERTSYFIDSFAISTDSSFSFTEIKKKGKQEKTYSLLYFTGYGAVNGRKMEEVLLEMPEVAKLYSSLHCYALFVDDRTPFDESTGDVKGEFKTKGQYWIAIEKQNFDSDRQPFFVLLNPKGKVVAAQEYTLEKAVFMEFLNQATPK